MSMTLMQFGPQWQGSTSLQRLEAFRQLPGIDAVGVDSGASIWRPPGAWARVRNKLRLPVDRNGENTALLAAVRAERPDIVVVDNSKVITRGTLRKLRQAGAGILVYYSPDDIVARHNLSLPLQRSLPHWDVVCTTKTFNIAELAGLGVRRPLLVGKGFDPGLHRPLQADIVGPDFERFDAVFAGSHEPQRCASINALAEAGVSVVVYGAGKASWEPRHLSSHVTLRESAFGEAYVAAWHSGKVALCFLRKINRDRITQRTMEIAAMGRPMAAERTDEHDAHFRHGTEYLGFRDDTELVTAVTSLLDHPERRRALGTAGRQRCLAGGYSIHDRAASMLEAFRS